MARLKPLADLVDHCLAPALQAQGFAASDVIVSWPDIVGERLAGFSQPVRMDWRRRAQNSDPEARPEPAALVVRVESAFALELQHLAPVIVERINAFYGWRCVGRLVLKQGPVRREAPARRREPALSPAQAGQVDAAVRPVEDQSLRAALDRLGRAVVGSGKR